MTASTPYALDPLQAYEGVMRFAARRGRSAVRLAMHAAMPEVLRPELLHQMRLNFVPESLPELAVEADVLFAPFCEDLGNGFFRFDPASRVLLLQELDTTYREKPRPRSQRLAAFLSAYVAHELSSGTARLDSLYRDYLEVEAWVALGFLDPDAAAEQLAQALADGFTPGVVAARARIGAIAGALSVPLAAHRRVIAYAKAVDAIDRGDTSTGSQLVAALGSAEVTVGSVVLPSAAEALAPRVAPAAASSSPAPSADRPSASAAAEQSTPDAPTSEQPRTEAPASEQATTRPIVDKVLIVCSPEDVEYAERLWKHFVPSAGIKQAELVQTSMENRIAALAESATVVVHMIGAQQKQSGFFQRLLGIVRRQDLPLSVLRDKPVVLAALSGADLSQEVMGQMVFPVRLSNDTWTDDVARLIGRVLEAASARTASAPAPADERDQRRPSSDDEPNEPQIIDVGDAAPSEPARARTDGQERPADGSTIYISHTRGHSFSYAQSLSREFRRHGYNVAEDLPAFVTESLDDMGLMLVLIGRGWADAVSQRGTERENPIVREIGTALRRKIRILPVLIDGVVAPEWERLPRELRPLAYVNRLVLRPDEMEEGVRQLLRVANDLFRKTADSDVASDAGTLRAYESTPSAVDEHAILFIGHTIDRPDRASQRFPARYEQVARDAIRDALHRQAERHSTKLHGIASGADGGDILFHEVCAELGIVSTLFLPVPPTRFIAEFLVPAGGDWARRFERLTHHQRIRVVQRDDTGAEAPTDYTQDPWYANGRAMLRAARPTDTRSGSLLALWNREWGGPGGPSDLIERARDLGMEVVVLDTHELFNIPPDSYYSGPT